MQKQIIDKLRPHQSFESADDMLKAVEVHIRTHHLNESAIRVLRFISGRAKAVAGAAWLKVRTIAEAEIVGVSERTVRRALKRLSDAGIITIHRQMRDKMGGCGASIYVINPVDVSASVRAQMTGRGGDERPQGTSIKPADPPVKKVFVKKAPINNGTLRTEALDKSFTSGIIPAKFRDLVGRYWNDALRIAHLYTRAIIATRKLGLPTVNDDIAIEAFKQSIQALKRGKIRGSFDGYFYGTVYQMTAAAHRRAANRRTLFDYAV